ncbi:hypothetical protein QYE76_015926 [Lolium multiflorum]|uniref:Uncharacterized protein n=1 Tax=Lolium multiflorum TaxID=4521 RepID=A0AAD8XA91_LOLMU|nr:hypothetical protein QYE76_015926 [Lolium multiflorum]
MGLAAAASLEGFRIVALAEQERLALEHRKALDAQEKVSSELKDKLVQAELRHARELKEAAEAKLAESLKDYTDASTRLRRELEEETRLRKEAQARNATLTTDQAEYDVLVVQADTLALNLFPESQPHAYVKVAERRAKQALSNPDAPWDAYDHLVTLAARISHMRPANLTLLSNRLKDAGKRFSDWRRSSARAGADAALRVACSWYEDLDLDALHSLRGGAYGHRFPASARTMPRIAESAATGTFIPPLRLRDEVSTMRRRRMPAWTRRRMMRKVTPLQSKLQEAPPPPPNA